MDEVAYVKVGVGNGKWIVVVESAWGTIKI
jgi:hypothetical protein